MTVKIWQQFCVEWKDYMLPCETACNHCALVEKFTDERMAELENEIAKAKADWDENAECDLEPFELPPDNEFFLKGYLKEFVALMQDDIDCGKVTQTVTRYNLLTAVRNLLDPKPHGQPYVGDPQEFPDVP